MFNQKRLSQAIGLALASTVLSAGMVIPAAAQVGSDDSQVEKISITGSRIQRANLVSTSPVTEISAEDIAISGVTRLEDLLNDMPQIFAAQTSAIANGATGTATVDLRGLGSTRTLTLLNGRRLPSGSPQAGGIGADINQIPAGLVDRVEILTGGASATYGSDAIAGVVNFILKDDFEGFSFDYQYAFSQHNNDNSRLQQINTDAGFNAPSGNQIDGRTHDFSIIMGANSANGRGNITLYATVRDVGAVLQGDRDYAHCSIRNEPNVCAGSGTIAEGRVTDFSSYDFIVSGDQFLPRNGETYNFGAVSYYQRPDERKTLGALGHYEITDDIEVFAELNFMDDRSVAGIAPSGAFFVTSTLNCSNPLLSAQQFDALCTQRGFGIDDTVAAFVGKRNVEGGNRQDDLRHTSFRGVIGARGLINEDWSFDIFANYGSVTFNQLYKNDLSTTAITRALNVVADPDSGDAVCQSVLDGSDPNCVPYNIFTTGGVTPAALAYISLPLVSKGETVTKQISGYVAGDLTDYGIRMPGTSYGASVVLGLEHREERLEFDPDQAFRTGDGAGQGGPTAAVSGEYDVDEFFTELNLPLLEDSVIANQLNLELAYRYSDYSTGQSTNTYKYAADWEINEQIRVRASYQRAVRAGNVRDLFRPQTLGLFNMNEDPCAGANPLYSFEQCERTGVTAAQYGNIADNPAGQYNSITGGNPDLRPEESDTVSVGVILAPDFLPGLDFALDYFTIDVNDAISNVPERFILDQCAQTGAQEFCSLINRSPTRGTLWIGSDNIVATDINIGYFETSGVDFDLSYKLALEQWGGLKFSLIGTYLTKWDQKSTPDAPVIECLGHWDRSSCGAPTPKLRQNVRVSWETPWDANVTATWRYFGETEELNNGPTTLSAQSYLDISASWQVMDNTRLRFGINNLLDKEPPIVPNTPSGIGNGNTFPGPFDAMGRYLFAGVNMAF